jgi:hypothetical protein
MTNVVAPFAGFLHHGAFLLAVVVIAWNVKVGGELWSPAACASALRPANI